MAVSVDSLVVDAVKVGVTSIVISRIAKTIGQKDIAEIIAGTGMAVVGFDVIGIVLPFASGVSKFVGKIDAWLTKIDSIFQGIDRSGILSKIINFGAKQW